MTGSSNNRRGPPAYQMYASDRLASRHFRAMSAAERGVLHSIELECWVNGSVPQDRRELAKVLGLEGPEVEDALTARVLTFLNGHELPEKVFFAPELEDYRQRLNERHEKMSAGGRKGAETLHQGRGRVARVNGHLNGQPSDGPTGPAHDHPNGPLKRMEQRSEEQNGSIEENALRQHQDFLDAYDGPAPFE